MGKYRDYYYKSHCGRLTLYARDYPGPDGQTDQPTILCMHGLTRNSADFEDLADHLSSSYRVISVDQRGRGKSEYDNDTTQYDAAVYCRDMITLMEGLGIDKVVFIGTSMGGLMSMIMASIIKDKIKGIVLNDIGPALEKEGIDRVAAFVGKIPAVHDWEGAAEVCRTINGLAFPDFNDEDWMRFARRTYVEDDNGVPVAAYDPAIGERMRQAEESAVPPDLWVLWDAMKDIPTLTIRGEISDILSHDTMLEMGRRHPNMRQLTLKGVGHAPMLSEPGAMNTIDDFLATI